MESITNRIELRNAIQLLEIDRTVHGQLVQEQINIIRDKLKPINIIKSIFNDIASSPHLFENIINTALGLVTGYFSRKIVVGASANIFRKILGSFLQVGVTNAVAQHPDAIKSLGQFIIQQIFRKRGKVNQEEESK